MTSTKPKPFSLSGTRLAVLVILAGLWVWAIADFSRIAYRIVPSPTSPSLASPHPEIGLATREPRLPFLDAEIILTGRGQVLWRQKEVDQRLLLFTARGLAGEPAVRLAKVDDSEGGVVTVGIAVREDSGWRFLIGSEAESVEEAERQRRERGGAERVPSLSAPPEPTPRSP